MATKRRSVQAARAAERRDDFDQGDVGGFEAGEDAVDAFARLADASQPQGKSRRRRGDDAKGLPDPETLRGLAELYLEVQRRLWPDLARRGLLPKPTPNVVERLAAEMKQFRAVATRYDKLGESFLATVKVVLSFIKVRSIVNSP